MQQLSQAEGVWVAESMAECCHSYTLVSVSPGRCFPHIYGAADSRDSAADWSPSQRLHRNQVCCSAGLFCIFCFCTTMIYIYLYIYIFIYILWSVWMLIVISAFLIQHTIIFIMIHQSHSPEHRLHPSLSLSSSASPLVECCWRVVRYSWYALDGKEILGIVSRSFHLDLWLWKSLLKLTYTHTLTHARARAHPHPLTPTHTHTLTHTQILSHTVIFVSCEECPAACLRAPPGIRGFNKLHKSVSTIGLCGLDKLLSFMVYFCYIVTPPSSLLR
jgi:hypothetical protein